jgi:hypothetical protein
METMETTHVKPEALVGCEGFGVYGPTARIGSVEEVRTDSRDGRPRFLLVRAGLLGSWLVHVPVDQIDAVDVEARRLDLRPGGLLAGPRNESS